MWSKHFMCFSLSFSLKYVPLPFATLLSTMFLLRVGFVDGLRLLCLMPDCKWADEITDRYEIRILHCLASSYSFLSLFYSMSLRFIINQLLDLWTCSNHSWTQRATWQNERLPQPCLNTPFKCIISSSLPWKKNPVLTWLWKVMRRQWYTVDQWLHGRREDVL